MKASAIRPAPPERRRLPPDGADWTDQVPAETPSIGGEQWGVRKTSSSGDTCYRGPRGERAPQSGGGCPEELSGSRLSLERSRKRKRHTAAPASAGETAGKLRGVSCPREDLGAPSRHLSAALDRDPTQAATQRRKRTTGWKGGNGGGGASPDLRHPPQQLRPNTQKRTLCCTARLTKYSTASGQKAKRTRVTVCQGRRVAVTTSADAWSGGAGAGPG